MPVDTVYRPRSGDGGQGTSQGGDSGKVGAAGVAGNGGVVIFKTMAPPPELGIKSDPPKIEPDRINVNGGHAGSQALAPFEVTIDGIVISLTITIPAGDGVQRGKSGNGGNGDAGGNAGAVGGGVVGGDAGSIEVSSDASIKKSVYFLALGARAATRPAQPEMVARRRRFTTAEMAVLSTEQATAVTPARLP